ncbi:hypothetical protein SCOCK_140072 [Actinacidiphila cocklensis]|uniref:Uncharacterized protein n=1 Tax=Actinacidiphila cocklensis TaxID=887465 RepID=A0A9W4GPS1_9ACTN|nr:hypothetical protein SCOCK_140072 [Actinacidiphila cocklensis]
MCAAVAAPLTRGGQRTRLLTSDRHTGVQRPSRDASGRIVGPARLPHVLSHWRVHARPS